MRKYSGTLTMNHFLVVLFSVLLCSSGYELKAQGSSYRVLFLGNSYTSVNNLPQLVHDVAQSVGDTLLFDSHTPGGYALENHMLDATSKNKIMAGGWDYVVLQGQSQEPIAYSNQFGTGGRDLYELIKQYNPCAITMPYMTWGRKNGDASLCPYFPEGCTYQRMDSAIKSKYLRMTDYFNSEVAPVSVVWKYLRQNHPSINLYQADDSHPTPEGSYAAACCFYTSIFKKDPTPITFNFGLSAGDASIIRNAVKTQVFDSLQVWDYKRLPDSRFNYQIGSGLNQVNFSLVNYNVRQSYAWNFGDGGSSTLPTPSHSYLTNGTYTVSLTTSNCDLQGTYTSISDTVIQFCNHTPTVFTSHGWLCEYDTIWTQPADSYQWLLNNALIPETNQYIANYYSYNSWGFSVLSTSNGCTELSKPFTKNPVWSGYYFDILGSPCNKDSVAWAVLHTNGFLSGSEHILWFKNDLLLPSVSNEDTLWITSQGKYECKVINPNSNCPLDTTWYTITYNCGGVVLTGIEEKKQDLSWNIFPNPASESITIRSKDALIKEQLEIYNSTGRLIKTIEASGTTSLNIADLPNGLYFVRQKSNKQASLKFIKQ